MYGEIGARVTYDPFTEFPRWPTVPAYAYRQFGPPDALDPIRSLAAAWDGVACKGPRPVDTLDFDICPVCRHKGVTDVEEKREFPRMVVSTGGMTMRDFEVSRITLSPCGCLVEPDMWIAVAEQDTDATLDDPVVCDLVRWVWKRQP